MKRNLILSSLLVIIVSLVFTGVVMAQDDPESGYPVPTPDPIDYEYPSDENCTHYNWLAICDEWESDELESDEPAPIKQPAPVTEPAPIKRSKWVDPPAVIVQMRQVAKPSIMELIEGLRMMLRMR